MVFLQQKFINITIFCKYFMLTTYSWSVIERDVLKSTTVIVNLSLSPCNSMNFPFIHFNTILRCTEVYDYYIFLVDYVYQHEISLFMSFNAFCLKFYLVCYQLCYTRFQRLVLAIYFFLTFCFIPGMSDTFLAMTLERQMNIFNSKFMESL